MSLLITTIYTGFKLSTIEFGIKIFIYPTERWNIGGSYTFGSLSIEVYPSSGGLTVDILEHKNRRANTNNHPKLTI
jgi:hypothetical protein